MSIKSAHEKLSEGPISINVPELLINGPELLDCNVRKWQKGDSVGIIAGSGIGKTSFLMWNFKSILMNNPEGICVIIACEMSESQLLAKWQKATKDCPEIGKRLYIVTAYDENGISRDLSMPGIRNILNLYRNTLNTEILSYVIDHLHIIQRPNNEDLSSVVYSFTRLNRELGALGFLTSQTTKGKSGPGDVPLDKTACFGTSSFEWEMTQIYTLCQPLKRIEDQVSLPVTAWQLAKNRFKEKEDTYKESSNYLLKFNFDDESYSKLTRDELIKFNAYYESVIELRMNEEKKGEFLFDTSYTITGKDGTLIKVYNEISSEDKKGW